jgi:NAD(P)H-hydrate epimerase
MPETEPLYTADEMRAAEARYPGYPETVPELMERAGGAAAVAALELFHDARRWTVVCGGGSNGGDGHVMATHLERAGREVHIVDAKAGETDLGEPDVIVDALFGTGFSGEPRPDAAALIERINGSGARVFAVDLPSGVDASTGEVARTAVRADATVTGARSGSRLRRAGSTRAPFVWSTSGWSRWRPSTVSSGSSCSAPCRGGAPRTTSTPPDTSYSSVALAVSPVLPAWRRWPPCVRTRGT